LSGPNYLELSVLQQNRRYDFWVKAETSKGYGPSSDITSIILARTSTENIFENQRVKWHLVTCHFTKRHLCKIAFL
jgi:hypothetical protein